MNRQFLQIISIVLLILIGLGILVFVKPLMVSIKDLKLQTASAGTELQSLQAEQDRLAEMAVKIGDSDAQKKDLLKAIPVGNNQEEILSELSALAKTQGLVMNSVNFALSTSADFGNSITIAANFEATYDKLITFLQKIENAERLYKVKSINVQLTSSSTSVFNLNLEAYYQ